MRRPPSLTSLRLFMHVAHNKSFSEAGRIAHISQPALSRTIRLLEEELGVRLLDRNSRNVALTSAGETLLPIVERLTADFDGAFSELAATFSGTRGRVVVGVLPSVAAALLPRTIVSFQETHPQVEIILRDQISGSLYQQLSDRQLDLAITTPPSGDGIQFDALFDDDWMLVCPSGSKFDRPGPARWSEFSGERFIAMAPRSSVREITDQAMAKADVRAQLLYDCTQLATVGGLIAAGLGITALPRATLGMLQVGAIAARLLIEPKIERTIGIARRLGRTLPPAAEAFVQHLARELKGDGAVRNGFSGTA